LNSSEILNYFGFLDETTLPEEGKQLFLKAREGLVHTIHQGREVLQRRINVETVQSCVERDPMTTTGFITGVVASLVL